VHILFRYFENPNPEEGIIINEVGRLRIAVTQALKAPRTRQRIVVEFRQDVFQHIFANKGYALGQWKVLDKEDFPVKFSSSPPHGMSCWIFMARVQKCFIQSKQGISSHGPQRDLLRRTILS
jgi:hypothetical protein